MVVSSIGIGLSFAYYPLSLTANTVVLMLVGAMAGSRTIKIAERVNLCVCHPFIFAAMILEGPNEAILVATVNVVGASVLRRGKMLHYQVGFNVGIIATTSLVTWQVYSSLLGQPASLLIERAAVPVLVASLVFFLMNTLWVAAVLSITNKRPIGAVWHESFLWSGPSFVAGGTLGLLVALLMLRSGRVGVLLSIPFVLLIYYSYRLYLDKLREKKTRIEMMERVNADLEVKVRERTEEYEVLTEQLRASNQQLAEASRLKSEFLANVSHELRTPLNAIIGFSELLQSLAFGDLTEEQAEFIGDIHSSGTNLLALINDILDLSKIEAGKMELQTEEWEPETIVAEAVSMVRLLASNKGIELDYAVAEDAGCIVADSSKVKQILSNLLSNAIKFTPEWGSVRVDVERTGEEMVFSVTDTGIGIAPEDVERIFGEFFQVDGSYTRRYAGTGLGLALVRKFVELQGGRVAVESELGRGSRFSFWLPLVVEHGVGGGELGADEFGKDDPEPETSPASTAASEDLSEPELTRDDDAVHGAGAADLREVV